MTRLLAKGFAFGQPWLRPEQDSPVPLTSLATVSLVGPGLWGSTLHVLAFLLRI